MVNKTKILYDILSIILVLWILFLIVGSIVSGPVKILHSKTEIITNMLTLLGLILYLYAYSIAVIILIIAKQKGTANIFAIIIGSIIIPGLLPIIYYIFFLRKRLNGINEYGTTIQ